MKQSFKILAMALVLSAALVSSCKKDKKEETTSTPTPTATPTLYARLGGIGAISAVVDKFAVNCATNAFIGPRFAPLLQDSFRLKYFKYNLVDQICAGTGGPCSYKGKTMLQAHQGMNISAAEFDTLAGQLIKALNFYNVPAQEQTDLVAILVPMQPDVVGH